MQAQIDDAMGQVEQQKFALEYTQEQWYKKQKSWLFYIKNMRMQQKNAKKKLILIILQMSKKKSKHWINS